MARTSVTGFAVGQVVRLTRCRADNVRGHLGTITKVIKSREVLRVELCTGPATGSSYDADAPNVDHPEPSESELVEALAASFPERERREHERAARIMANELQRADDAQLAGGEA